MCGLIGVINKYDTNEMSQKQTTAFQELLYANALRGFDSTGIAAIKQNKTVKVTKDACSPGTFFFRHNNSNWEKGNKALIGHNRSATKGKVNKNNAHPFIVDNITLAHNGTLPFHKNLKDVEVDSLAITHVLNERDTVKGLEAITGALALIWHDKRTNTIYATRNDQRPLHIIETDNTFFIGSEKELLTWIAIRNGFRITKEILCTPGIIYAFNLNTNNKPVELDNSVKWNHSSFKFKEYFNDYDDVEYEQKKLPNPTKNNVTQIKPATALEFDLFLNDNIELLAYSRKKLTANMHGFGLWKWEVESVQYPNVDIELYTDSDTDFSDFVINAKVKKTIWQKDSKTWLIIASDPSLYYEEEKKISEDIKEEPKSPTPNKTGHSSPAIYTKLLQDSCCSECAMPYKEEPNNIVIPVQRGNHIYKYIYYCNSCSTNLSRKKKPYEAERKTA